MNPERFQRINFKHPTTKKKCPCYNGRMAGQLYLFESETGAREDGSFIVRPRRLVDGREISAGKAAEMLGFKDRETIYRLIELGEIRGWKPGSKRGNGKFRIDLGSVIDYKTRRILAARG